MLIKPQVFLKINCMNIHEAMEYIYGSLNDVENRHSYFKGEVVALPKEEADYYLNSFCGGEVTMRGMGGKLEKTHHKYNIDNQQGFYEKKDMARFHREHKPLAVAELYNG